MNCKYALSANIYIIFVIFVLISPIFGASSVVLSKKNMGDEFKIEPLDILYIHINGLATDSSFELIHSDGGLVDKSLVVLNLQGLQQNVQLIGLHFKLEKQSVLLCVQNQTNSSMGLKLNFKERSTPNFCSSQERKQRAAKSRRESYRKKNNGAKPGCKLM